MRVKPAEGLKVRDPERSGHLPAEGAEVPDTEYWRRRLADADVVTAAVADQAPVVKTGKSRE